MCFWFFIHLFLGKTAFVMVPLCVLFRNTGGMHQRITNHAFYKQTTNNQLNKSTKNKWIK